MYIYLYVRTYLYIYAYVFMTRQPFEDHIAAAAAVAAAAAQTRSKQETSRCVALCFSVLQCVAVSPWLNVQDPFRCVCVFDMIPCYWTRCISENPVHFGSSKIWKCS